MSEINTSDGSDFPENENNDWQEDDRLPVDSPDAFLSFDFVPVPDDGDMPPIADATGLRGLEEPVWEHVPPADVRAWCAVEVEAGIADAFSQFTQVDTAAQQWGVSYDEADFQVFGGGDGGLYRTEAVSRVIALQAREAAIDGDLPTAEQKLDLLDQLVDMGADIPTDAYIETCFTARGLGSDRAATRLAELLEEERRQLSDIMPWEWHSTYGRNERLGAARLLRHVLSACEARDIPPTQWVDTYAAGPEWCWHLTVGHYRTAMERHPEQAAYYREQCDAALRDVVQSPAFGPAFVFSEMTTAWEIADREETRSVLLEGFKRLAPAQPDTVAQYDWLVDFGARVALDPALATPENLAYFKDCITAHGDDLLRRDEFDYEDMVLLRLPWEAAAMRARGVEPGVILTIVQQQLAVLFSETTAHTDSSLATHYRVLIRDMATRAVCSKDFTAARLYISTHPSAEERGMLLSDGLAQAETLEDVALLTSDDDTAALYPHAELYVDFARARLSESPQAVTEFITRQITRIADDETGVQRNFMYKAFTLLQERDPAAANDMARRIVRSLRLAGYSHYDSEPYSAALIAAGDTVEPLQAYEYIKAGSRDDASRRLLELQNLALRIRAAQR